MLWYFSLQNVLCAAASCTCSTSQLPKAARNWHFLTPFTSRCASHHSGLQSFISAGSAPAALASLLVDPPEPQIIGKTQCCASFLPFPAPASFLFWLSSLWSFPSLIFSLLTFSMSALLPGCAFPSVHVVGTLTSKLPSTIKRTVIKLSCNWRRWQRKSIVIKIMKF